MLPEWKVVLMDGAHFCPFENELNEMQPLYH